MKLLCLLSLSSLLLSRPARGAWVEIRAYYTLILAYCQSRPARGAWVEILILIDEIGVIHVAPRKGRVG